jgi:hypothetical protein
MVNKFKISDNRWFRKQGAKTKLSISVSSLFQWYVLGEIINITKKDTETLSDTSDEVGLQANAEKTKCMFVSHHQYTGQNHNINTADKFLENASKLKTLL